MDGVVSRSWLDVENDHPWLTRNGSGSRFHGASCDNFAFIVSPAGSDPADSTFQSEERLRAFYPEAKPEIMEGDTGFGLVEDPAYFHKALVPGHGNRLVLQLRYS